MVPRYCRAGTLGQPQCPFLNELPQWSAQKRPTDVARNGVLLLDFSPEKRRQKELVKDSKGDRRLAATMGRCRISRPCLSVRVPHREITASKSRADFQPDSFPNRKVGKGGQAHRRANLKTNRPFSLPGTGIFLGTSAFTAKGWEGSFYPRGMQSRDFLSYYATQFATVEVDSTFYGCPSPLTVNNWAARTPEDFIFSVKIPQLCGDENYVATRSEGQCFRTVFDFVGHII